MISGDEVRSIRRTLGFTSQASFGKFIGGISRISIYNWEGRKSSEIPGKAEKTIFKALLKRLSEVEKKLQSNPTPDISSEYSKIFHVLTEHEILEGSIQADQSSIKKYINKVKVKCPWCGARVKVGASVGDYMCGSCRSMFLYTSRRCVRVAES